MIPRIGSEPFWSASRGKSVRIDKQWLNWPNPIQRLAAAAQPFPCVVGIGASSHAEKKDFSFFFFLFLNHAA